MVGLLMVMVVVGAGCWGFRIWLDHQEKKATLASYRSIPDVEDRFVALAALEPEVLPIPPSKRPMNKWLLIGLCFAYIIWPIDILPDFIPVLGWGDDLTAAVIAFRAAFNMAPLRFGKRHA